MCCFKNGPKQWKWIKVATVISVVNWCWINDLTGNKLSDLTWKPSSYIREKTRKGSIIFSDQHTAWWYYINRKASVAQNKNDYALHKSEGWLMVNQTGKASNCVQYQFFQLYIQKNSNKSAFELGISQTQFICGSCSPGIWHWLPSVSLQYSDKVPHPWRKGTSSMRLWKTKNSIKMCHTMSLLQSFKIRTKHQFFLVLFHFNHAHCKRCQNVCNRKQTRCTPMKIHTVDKFHSSHQKYMYCRRCIVTYTAWTKFLGTIVDN